MGKVYDPLGIEKRVVLQTWLKMGGHLWVDCGGVGSLGVDDLA